MDVMASRHRIPARCALVAALALPCAAVADIYRCVGADGRTSYSDSPCPRASTSTNVTEQVQACATPECEARLEKTRAEAKARLAEEKATVLQMQEQRRKAEAAELEQRIRLEQLRRQAALDLAQQEPASVTYAPAYPYPAYPLYPGYGPVGRWDGVGCRDLECRPVARPLPAPVRGGRVKGGGPGSLIDPPGAYPAPKR
jgi:hypothetical protein